MPWSFRVLASGRDTGGLNVFPVGDAGEESELPLPSVAMAKRFPSGSGEVGRVGAGISVAEGPVSSKPELSGCPMVVPGLSGWKPMKGLVVDGEVLAPLFSLNVEGLIARAKFAACLSVSRDKSSRAEVPEDCALRESCDWLASSVIVLKPGGDGDSGKGGRSSDGPTIPDGGVVEERSEKEPFS